jgi:hypothetical protein
MTAAQPEAAPHDAPITAAEARTGRRLTSALALAAAVLLMSLPWQAAVPKGTDPLAQGWWSEDEETAWIAESNAWADAEVDAYLATTVQPVEAMFDYLYAELPHDVAEQREQALGWEKR